jgi:hypothetical protein
VKARNMPLAIPKVPAQKNAQTGRYEPGKGDRLMEAHRKAQADAAPQKP